MITIEEALFRILDHCQPLPHQSVPLPEALNCVLARDIYTADDLPPFDASAADGYACRSGDLPEAGPENQVVLRFQDTVVAGGPPGPQLAAGATVRILTGAPIPPGADCVVMQEFVQARGVQVIFSDAVKAGENIRRRGSELPSGSLVLPSGLPISPAGVAMLATLGLPSVEVHRKPRAAVIATGSELVSPGQPLLPGQIRDSNSFGLAAALQALQIETVRTVTVPDDPQLIEKELGRALEEADLILLTGGVSVGDRDFVKEVASSLGVREVFWRIAMKPGKPNFLGVKDRKLLFGLPGNPVAALLSFHLLVRPAIARLSGLRESFPLRLTAALGSELRKKPGRTEFVRALLTKEGQQWTARPLQAQDSNMMSGLAQATALIVFPLEAEYLPAGHAVDVIPLYWNELG